MAIIALAALAIGGVAVAQMTPPAGMDHSNMGHTIGVPGTAAEVSPAANAFAEANARMHKDMIMIVSFTGDADVDFIKGMLPHHQGAVDMAKIVLQYGKDADVKKLAGEIIKAQETEIAWMNDWLKKNATPPLARNQSRYRSPATMPMKTHSSSTLPAPG